MMHDEQEPVVLPYYIHEGEMARMERANKRWFVAFLVTLILLCATNAGWIIYEHQFETYTVEQQVDTGTGSAFVAGVGDVRYGESNAEGNSPGQEDQQPESDEAVPEV